jgi:hypothetical protein
MTEPALLTAFIPMGVQTYQRFLKGKGGEAFARAAADIIVNGSEDYLVLRYLKTEAALYLAYIFRWADLPEDIVKRPYFKGILDAGGLVTPGARGRALISPGALNFLSDGVEAAFTITSGDSRRDDNVPDDEMRFFDGLLNTYVFKGAEIGAKSYQEAMLNAKVLDPKLRKQVGALLELDRQRVARERVPKATALHPVRLFEAYHYNGHFVVFRETGGLGVRPAPGLDPDDLRPAPWGASDSRHVVVSGRVIETDPSDFKVHVCGEEPTFFTDARYVYGPDLAVLPGADPKKFRCIKGAFAHDKMRWYNWKGVALPDVGNAAQVDDSLYFLRFNLLVGDQSIYMGETRLPLHAASCTIKRLEQFPPGPFTSFILGWFADKDGDLIVASHSLDQELRLERTTDPEVLWQNLKSAGVKPPGTRFKELWNDLRAATPMALKATDVETQTAFMKFFESWQTEAFAVHCGEQRYADHFWTAINNYFYCCWHQKQYRKIVDLYVTIEQDAWWHPELFHHTACAFVALGDLDLAVREVRRALTYGYQKIDSLMTDPDIRRLFDLDAFKLLKAFHEANTDPHKRFLPIELVENLAANGSMTVTYKVISAVMLRFFVPGHSAILAAYAEETAERAAYLKALTSVIDGLVNKAWQKEQKPYDFDKLYRAIGDIPGLSPATHLVGALSLYSEGLFWVDMSGDDSKPRVEFAESIRALGRMKTCLATDPDLAADPVWTAFANNAVAAPFIAMAHAL